MKYKIVVAITALLILLLMYSAGAKAIQWGDYAQTMRNQPLPHWLTQPLTVVIPLAQLITVACLISEKFRRTGLFASIVLLTLPTFYIIALLLQFFPWVPCSCGNAFRWLSWQQLLWLHLSFLSLTGLALRLMVTKRFSSPLNVHV